MQPRNAPEAPVTQGSDNPAAPTPAGESGLLFRILRGAGISVGLGLIFAWFGVYDTGNFPFADRVVYWTGLMAVGITSGTIITPLVSDRWLPKAHAAVQIIVASLLISIPITIGLIIMEAAGDGAVAPPWWIGMQYIYVLVVTLLLTSLAWVVERYSEKQVAPASVIVIQQPAPPGATAGAFADRLPVKFRTAEIHAVSAEDHYLRVHTSAGEIMILMRLADAVRELAGLEGLQTHRSWWVARQGVSEVVRMDGKISLKLKSGAEAPVSRTYVKAVKDAGW